MEALEKFVEESSVPVVTVFNSDLRNHPFITKFFNSPNTKVISCPSQFCSSNFEPENSLLINNHTI